jgi:hypothetical protein
MNVRSVRIWRILTHPARQNHKKYLIGAPNQCFVQRRDIYSPGFEPRERGIKRRLGFWWRKGKSWIWVLSKNRAAMNGLKNF